MKKSIKRLWVKALRSGEYVQGNGSLRQIDPDTNVKRYCCLGVLCDLYAKKTGEGEWISDFGDFAALGYTQELFPPIPVRKWAGLDPRQASPIVDGISLANRNDGTDVDQQTFIEIADLIEAYL